MKRLLRTKTFWLTAAAVVLVGSMSIHEAMAYFTTYVTAKGGYPITLGSSSTVEEQVENMTKKITITNTGATECYVRVKVFSGDMVDISYSGAVDGSGSAYWIKNESDGYWYYKDIVPAGGKTEVLQAKIQVAADYEESFDVIVIQECTPVLYNADGTPYADWERKLDTKTDIGTGN